MSDIWLVLAIGCVFGAIVLLGIFVDLSQSERRRAVRLLESQVAGTTSENVNLREQHLSESFGSRIIVPVVAGAARVARRVTPIDARDRVARKLLLAGSPDRMGRRARPRVQDHRARSAASSSASS